MDYEPTQAFKRQLLRNEARVMLLAAASPHVASQMGWDAITAEDVRAAFGEEAAAAWDAVRYGHTRFLRAVDEHLGKHP
jgi:hypothetical protein